MSPRKRWFLITDMEIDEMHRQLALLEKTGSDDQRQYCDIMEKILEIVEERQVW